MPATERTGCPSHEQLAAFSLGNVTEQALETIAGHLQGCTSCASALSTVRDGGDSLLGGLRRPTSAEQFLDEPEYRQAVERVQGIGYAPAPSDRRDAETLRPIPRELGRYEILEELGCGGMGTVYLARDTLLRREVALKIPHFRRSDDPRRLERFYREARAAATLEHPNLCPVYDVGETDEIPYLSMARIKGKSLAKLLKQRERFSEREAAEIVRKVALAVEKAHAGGIVHRDIKPSNIMITEEGEPILTDFGLAQRLELEDPRLTRSGVIVGTPSYMAPEQVEGDPETLGPACDVYSLGVVLYELLTGRVPFEGPLLSVLKQLGEDQPAPPSTHRPDVDRRLEAICLKALAKDPGVRHKTAGQLADALEQYLQAPAPPSRRRLAWLRIAGAAALLLVLATVITVVTDRGTLEIKILDEDVKVSILSGGQEVRIVDTKTKKRITLHAGKYELKLSEGKPGLRLSTREFTLRRGDKVIVEVRASTDAHNAGRLRRGGILSPAMFTEPVPVLMEPPWDGARDAKPCVTADGQWFSFKKYVPFQLHTAKWNESNQRWENIEHVTGLGQSWTNASCISPDGQWLFYCGSSGRQGTVYRSPRLGDHWGPGQRIDAVNDPFGHVDQPYFNGSRLYFEAQHSYPDLSSTDIYYCDYDPGTDTFGTPKPVDPIDDDKGVNVAGHRDSDPALSADGQTLFWCSNRPGGEGGYDIWMSNWNSESDSWGVPVNLGPLINTAGPQYDPSYNRARNSLYFINSDQVLVESKVIPRSVDGTSASISIPGRRSARIPKGGVK